MQINSILLDRIETYRFIWLSIHWVRACALLTQINGNINFTCYFLPISLFYIFSYNAHTYIYTFFLYLHYFKSYGFHLFRRCCCCYCRRTARSQREKSRKKIINDPHRIFWVLGQVCMYANVCLLECEAKRERERDEMNTHRERYWFSLHSFESYTYKYIVWNHFIKNSTFVAQRMARFLLKSFFICWCCVCYYIWQNTILKCMNNSAQLTGALRCVCMSIYTCIGACASDRQCLQIIINVMAMQRNWTEKRKSNNETMDIKSCCKQNTDTKTYKSVSIICIFYIIFDVCLAIFKYLLLSAVFFFSIFLLHC